ncbi:MAG: hypothetical protein HOV81_01020 [Kofleriaceae bacterium]|nr:hypothetical protein [Kofleriaceae bacterium]
MGSRLRRDAGVSIERTFLYKRDASDPVPEAIASGVELRIAPVSPAETGVLDALGLDDRDEWRQRFDRGDECYGAWLGSELVHYSWVQNHGFHPIGYAGIDVEVRPGELWIYNCRTSDAHRGQKIYPRTLQRIVNDRLSAGATTAWIYAAAGNVASHGGIARAGFVHVETLRALRIGRRYRPLASESIQALS